MTQRSLNCLKHPSFTHPIKEDVKKKFFSLPSEMHVVTCIQPCSFLEGVLGWSLSIAASGTITYLANSSVPGLVIICFLLALRCKRR